MNAETLAVDEIETTTTTTLKSNKPEWIRVKLPTGKKYTELGRRYRYFYVISEYLYALVWLLWRKNRAT